MIRIFRAVIALVVLVSCHAGAQETRASDSQKYNQLASEIDSIMQRTHTPGAAVALFEPDGSVWRYTAGLKNIARK